MNNMQSIGSSLRVSNDLNMYIDLNNIETLGLDLNLNNFIFNFSRKLIIFLVSISVLFILCGSIMLGAYFVCEAEYKHVQPVIVIGEVLDNDHPLDT